MNRSDWSACVTQDMESLHSKLLVTQHDAVNSFCMQLGPKVLLEGRLPRLYDKTLSPEEVKKEANILLQEVFEYAIQSAEACVKQYRVTGESLIMEAAKCLGLDVAGLSKMYSNQICPLEYIDPEYLPHYSHRSPKIDVYLFGFARIGKKLIGLFRLPKLFWCCDRAIRNSFTDKINNDNCNGYDEV